MNRPPIQYALESLPELLCEHDYKLLCRVIFGRDFMLPHRDSLRNQLQQIVDERKRDEFEQEFKRYEENLKADAEGWRDWTSIYSHGPSKWLIPELGAPSPFPLSTDMNVVHIEWESYYEQGITFTTPYTRVNWYAVKRWRVK